MSRLDPADRHGIESAIAQAAGHPPEFDVRVFADRVQRVLEALDAAEAPIKSDGMEIVDGWLVEVHPGDEIPGYGTVPGSDLEPIVRLDTLPGWPVVPDERHDAEAALARIRSEITGYLESLDDHIEPEDFERTLHALRAIADRPGAGS